MTILSFRYLGKKYKGSKYDMLKTYIASAVNHDAFLSARMITDSLKVNLLISFDVKNSFGPKK